MSDNDKKEEKWTMNFRDDQLRLIREAMLYLVERAGETINLKKPDPFALLTAETVNKLAQEIADQIEETIG